MDRRENITAIQAGAGTGKTTRIIEFMRDALVEERLEPTRLVALTFTVKAANEMRERLGKRLAKDEDEKAKAALAQIDRMEIGTIHSFASHILRQFPVEAGISPGFEVDERLAAEDLFREMWPVWIRDQVPPFLDRAEPEAIRAFAREICEPGVPLAVRPDADWKEEISRAADRVRSIRTTYADGEQAENRRCLEAADYMLSVFGGSGDRRHRSLLDKGAKRPKALKAKPFKGWTDDEWASFSEARALANAVLDTDDALMADVLRWLRPFVDGFRREYRRRGFVSLHGLLVESVELLRGNEEIRGHFKERFRRILVDEFQDTDPLQGELLLFLAEKKGSFERNWEKVEVEPGKLVIVGDPKQSIYLFRGADLDAYDAIKNKLTGKDGKGVERLTKNWRSRQEIIDVVNAACSRNMTSPEYEAIGPSPNTETGGTVERLAFPDLNAEEARQAEAEAIAQWIRSGEIRWGDVAILLRSLTSSSQYTEALRKAGIEYAIEGEKTFWRKPEIVDFVNLLTAIVHPANERAMVGVLRSPLGAVPDRDLLHLRDAGALCPLDIDRVPETMGPVRRLYEAISDLHHRSRRLPPAELVRRTLERLPLREIWVESYRGEQAVANLEKIAAEVSSANVRTLDAALVEAQRRARDQEDEGESPLADEQLNAVRIMSVHKAKGLEFPVVVLADLHRKFHKGSSEGAVAREWLTRRVGLQLGSIRNSERWFVEKNRSRKSDQERDRLLYVALTRAKERLLLTGGRPDGNNYLGQLDGVPGVTDIVPPAEGTKTGRDQPPPEPDPETERRLWVDREADMRRVLKQEPIRRPSISEDDFAREERGESDDESREGGRTLGIRLHDLLAEVDLRNPPTVSGEDGDILNPFFQTEAVREIASAEQVVREIPFVLDRDGEVWSGQIDVLYRREGRWIVADWKSDRSEQPKKYRQQKEIYVVAVKGPLELTEPPEFRLIYLRTGNVIPI